MGNLSNAERDSFSARAAQAAMSNAANLADRSLIVSPPSSGRQVIVDPVQFKPSLRRGSTLVALLLALLQYLPDIFEVFKSGMPPEHVSAPWASALVIFAIAMRDGLAAHGAATVAKAAVDPLGKAAAVEEVTQARVAELAAANAAKIDQLIAQLAANNRTAA